ncbi:hypothetical protein BKP64_09650 [Marinobacter salinus]|uniref:Uncharacterized protein n=1 Tax=Marinobacter salinus TaxID=1874317 RepID=A0A1D9GS74_9GAMM|nr:hypothetical protein BKP64_09650 [Marinobacter salinus]
MALMLPVAPSYAADQDQDRDQTQMQDQTRLKDRDGYPVYGYGMMTEQERAEFRERMRSMDSMAERQAYREQHHQRMVERARARGIDIENLPPTAAGQPGGMNGKGMMNKDQKGKGAGMNQSSEWKKNGAGGGKQQ